MGVSPQDNYVADHGESRIDGGADEVADVHGERLLFGFDVLQTELESGLLAWRGC